MTPPRTANDPHAAIDVHVAGAALSGARLALVLVHGRGGSADDMLALFEALDLPDVAARVPEAEGRSWYPLSFLAPMPQNEPALSSALGAIGRIVQGMEQDGIPADRIALLGFSQGACLSLEFAARHARRYAAVLALSGGLIGPPGTPREYTGTMDGTPVLLGCSDVDAHIPEPRVRESAAVFARLGAAVDLRIYPGMGHTINRDELQAVRALLGGR